jgi:hypothetical protein
MRRRDYGERIEAAPKQNARFRANSARCDRAAAPARRSSSNLSKFTGRRIRWSESPHGGVPIGADWDPTSEANR